MTDSDDVLAAARRRAVALTSRDEHQLRDLLHPQFCWVSHRGDWFDRESYLESNQRGVNRWRSQELYDVEVRVVGDTAVLRCRVTDQVDVGTGVAETFTMAMTQTWVREGGRWLCLAGHAGPRVTT